MRAWAVEGAGSFGRGLAQFLAFGSTLGGHTLRPDSGDRDQGNPFDGSATGARDTSMTFGTDVDGFQATLGRDPALTVSTRQDVLLFGAAVVSVQTRP